MSERIIELKNVPENLPCEDCNSCLRSNLFEMGFLPGSKVVVKKYQNGLWILNLMNKNDTLEKSIALREEDAMRIFFEDSKCSFKISEF